MTNIKQSLLAALCTLVSLSVANATHDRPSEPRFRCGTQSCPLRRPAVIAQQASVDERSIADEPEEITLQEESMSQQIPTMQAPATLDSNKPVIGEELAVAEPAVEEVDVIQSNESELPAADNATEQSALDIETSASDIYEEPVSEDLVKQEEATLL